MMYKLSNKWLSARTRKKINKEAKPYKKAKLDTWTDKIKNFIKKPTSALVVIPFVFIICSIFIFEFLPYIKFLPLSKEQALDLLDDRLGNLIAIFSISIAISVFIVNAIQSKRSTEDQSSVIFEESYLYPIIYFILTSILIFSGVTYFKAVNFVSDNAIIRLSILFLVIFWISLFLIAFLFIRIYKFLNTTILYNKYLIRVQQLIEEDFFIELSQRTSRKLYGDFMMEFERLKPINLFFPKDISGMQSIYLGNQGIVVLIDVNLKKLNKLIRLYFSKDSTFSYRVVGISDRIYENTALFNISEDKASQFFDEIKKVFETKKLFKTKQKKSDKVHIEFERLRNGLLYNVKNENLVEVENILEKYKSILNTFAKLLKAFEIEKKINDYPPENFFHQEWKVIYDIQTHIYPAFEKAIQENNREIILEIMGHVYSILMISVQENSQMIFNKYRNLFILFYSESFHSNEYKDLIINKISHYVIELIDYSVLDMYKHSETFEEKVGVIRFFNSSVNIAAQISKSMIDRLDFKGFNFLVKSFERIVESCQSIKEDDMREIIWEEESTSNPNLKLSDELVWWSKIYLFGIYSWILYVYKENKIDGKSLERFLEKIILPAISFEENLKQIQASFSKESNLFGWDHWGNEERWESRRVFSPLTTEAWLPLSFLVNILKMSPLDVDQFNYTEMSEVDEYFVRRIEYFKKSIIDSYTKWENIFGNIDKDLLIKRFDSLISLFVLIRERQQKKIADEIIAQNLSQVKIAEFKEDVIKSWRETNSFRSLFEKYHNHRLIENQDSSYELFKLYALNNYFINWKKLFVDKHSEQIIGIADKANMVYNEEEFFLNQMSRINPNCISFESMMDAISENLSKRDEKNVKTTLLLISSKMFHENFHLLLNDNLFTPNWKIPNELTQYNFNGLYRDIPILSVDNIFIPNSIIFCDFQNCFEMIVRKDADKVDNMLTIQVELISEEEIEKSIKKFKEGNIEDWMKNNDGTTKNEEELAHILKNSIQIVIYETLLFVIKDENLLDIAIVNQISS